MYIPEAADKNATGGFKVDTPFFYGLGNEFSLPVVGTEQHGDGESCTYRVSNLFTL